MKVIDDSQAPVLPSDGSSVIAPVASRSLVTSSPTSPSLPTLTGSSTFLPSSSSVAFITDSPGARGYTGRLRLATGDHVSSLRVSLSGPGPSSPPGAGIPRVLIVVLVGFAVLFFVTLFSLFALGLVTGLM